LAVALAYDNAFDCYFPDTLDLLESRGATILDFSPLRDERLPPGTNLVYLGCGCPERYAAELSQNHCMKLALRNHLRGGGRIYAEGGGLAYLCQQIEIAEGDLWRMVGIFPAIACLSQSHHPPAPVEVTLGQESWLGQPGTRLRGYHNPRWQLKPVGSLTGCVVEPDHQYDLVKSCRAIGSQLHLNFAAQPNLLSNFFRPCLLQPDPADPWAAVP
jgi:cobyrinic acid a,c-diamide synthase